MSTVQRWGISLAIRIPQVIAGQLEVSEGTAEDLQVRDGELVVRPSTAEKLSLGKLLKNCKPAQLHGVADFGPNVGREVIN